MLPKSIRSRQDWPPGTKLIVEETTDGVLLKVASVFESTRAEDVFGCANYKGPPVSIEDMDKAIAMEVKRRHAGDRY